MLAKFNKRITTVTNSKADEVITIADTDSVFLNWRSHRQTSVMFRLFYIISWCSVYLTDCTTVSNISPLQKPESKNEFISETSKYDTPRL